MTAPESSPLFGQTVVDYAHSPAITVPGGLLVARAAEIFQEEKVTGAPVVDIVGAPLGVVSVTDLIALALFGAPSVVSRSAPDEDAARVPDVSAYADLRVKDIMTPAVWSAREDEPLVDAAARMVRARVHRLVVVGQAGRVHGILSTIDLMRATYDARIARPISDFGTRQVETVEVGTPISSVMRRLLSGGFTGMPVTDVGWPVGFISQAELLAARTVPPYTPVEEIASPAMLCLPGETPMWSAAQEGLRQTTRRILLVRSRQVQAILTSVDFARAVAELGKSDGPEGP